MFLKEKIKSYQELIVWQKSIELVVEVYKLTEKFPASERYGLTLQMKRAAISIPSNVAEGSGRGSRKDFRHFILHAYGSGAELETQVEIAKKLPFGKNLNYDAVGQLLDEVMRMLNTLANELNG